MSNFFESQFKNPIVHMDKDGNGYCRIVEFWEEQNYYHRRERIEATNDAKGPAAPYVKTGSWSDWERAELKWYLNQGLELQAIADKLCRSLTGVRRNIRCLKEREAKEARKNKKKVG